MHGTENPKFNIVQHLKVVTPDLNLYIENVKNVTSNVDDIYSAFFGPSSGRKQIKRM
jgi:hypothetical protein